MAARDLWGFMEVNINGEASVRAYYRSHPLTKPVSIAHQSASVHSDHGSGNVFLEQQLYTTPRRIKRHVG